MYYPFGEEATAFNQDAERMKFTGHERDLASPGGAGDDLDYMHARHCSPVTGRFLQIDPAVANFQQPQSWNGYSYARNNPMKYVDPSGMYIVNCAAGDEECQANAAAFEQARQENLKSEDQAIRDTALAWGDPGETNGVTLAFGNPGEGLGGTMSTRSQGNSDGSMGMETEVLIRSGLRGTELKAAVAHEGSHISDAQGFIASFTKNAASYQISRNLTSYQTELNAYRITHLVFAKSGQIFSMNCSGCKLGSSMKTSAQVDAAIKKILANPAGPYRVTEKNQGPRLFAEWPD